MPKAALFSINATARTAVLIAGCCTGSACSIGLAQVPVDQTPVPAASPAPAAGTADQPAASHPQLPRILSLTSQGRQTDAEQLCRRILRENPDATDVYQVLLKLTGERQAPVESPSFVSAQNLLPQVFDTHQSDRFVLLSDADADRIRQHARWVERTYEEFQRFAENCGLRPLPLQHKLVCILFEDHEDYRTFARYQDGVMNDAISGYYSPRHDRVVFSLEPERSEQARAQRHSRNRSSNDSSRRVLGFNPGTAPEAAAEAGTWSDDATQIHEHQACDESAAKCVHETIHQLMFHTRLMSPDTQYPLWICEGLSTAFETDTPELPFGPDRDYAPRLEAFQAILDSGDLMPLRQLVGLTQLPSNDIQTIWKVYQQSYAVVTWICRHRQDQLRAYLSSMMHQPAGRLSTSRHLQLFEQAFGDVEDVEREWLNYEWSRLP